MRKIVSTANVKQTERLIFWKDVFSKQILPVDIQKVGDEPFEGQLEGMNVGPLVITRITQSAIRTEVTPAMIRRHGNHDLVWVTLSLSGTRAWTQGEREILQRPGEFVLLDRKPSVMLAEGHNSSLGLGVPRDRLERMLGPVSLCAGLTVGAEQASTSLVTSFVDELTRIQGRLSPDLADRLSSIAIDLLVTSLSERMAREAPRPLAGTLVVHRAKAYVEAHLGDPSLDPPQLAIAMGVSLRRLQQLFREHGENIAVWIWRRRLELAASRLSDPGIVHLPLGVVAYACGFISQSHFSQRFKDHYGMSPSYYRERSIALRLQRNAEKK